MTYQEAFDKVWNHFVVQKQPLSFMPVSHSCRYRGPDGSKCAVGVLIPDDECPQRVEAYSISQLCGTVPALQDFYSVDGANFLLQLQSTTHDAAVKIAVTAVAPPPAYALMRDRLGSFARRFGLTVPRYPAAPLDASPDILLQANLHIPGGVL